MFITSIDSAIELFVVPSSFVTILCAHMQRFTTFKLLAKLSTEFKEKHTETNWRQIEKMRHILVHDYYQINMDILWTIITDDLQPLKEQVLSYISEI